MTVTWRWRIYYGDKSHYSDEDGPAWIAPARNVQVILTADPFHNWAVIHRRDFYWYLPDKDQWEGGDNFGLWDYCCEPGPKRIIFGRALGNKEFRDILDYAQSQLPPKLGWNADEDRP